MVDAAFRNNGVEHFLQTKRLGAKLDVVILELATASDLELNREE